MAVRRGGDGFAHAPGRLRSFNDYREAYGLARMTNWDDLTSDAAVKGRLEAPARNVFDEATFTETGMQIISDTRSLQGIAERNCWRCSARRATGPPPRQ